MSQTGGKVQVSTQGNAIADAVRHRALLDRAAEEEQAAWAASDPAVAAEHFEEALYARLAALALEAA